MGGTLTAIVLLASCMLSAPAAGALSYVQGWGSTGTGNGQFDHPIAIAATPRSVYVADKGRVQEFTLDGRFFRSFCCWSNQALREPSGIAVGPDGTVYVTDPILQGVIVFSSTGGYERTIGSPGASSSPLGYLAQPRGIAVGENGDLFVADRERSRVDVYSSSGRALSSFTLQPINGVGTSPWGLAMGPHGNLYVATGSWIVEVTPAGHRVRYWGANGSADRPLTDGIGVAVGDHGRIFVADAAILGSGLFPGRIQEFDADGTYVGQWGNEPSARDRLNRPEGIAAVGSHLFVVSANNGKVQRYAF